MEKPKSPKSAKLSLASSRRQRSRPRAKPGSARKPAARRPRIPYSKEEIREIFRRFQVQRPEPKGELEHVNPFTLVVAVALSAQATDAGVNKATRALFAWPTRPKRCWRSARTGSATTSRPSGFTATRRKTSSR
jgi:endonuclease-3